MEQNDNGALDIERGHTAPTPTPTPTPTLTVDHPAMWALSYEDLLDVRQKLISAFGLEQSREFNMRDVNEIIIKPECQTTGTSYALSRAPPEGLKIDAFVTHCWDEPFSDFCNSIIQAFHKEEVKPNLWICSFALNQYEIATNPHYFDDLPIEESPFVRALQQARLFLVVRNSVVDIYSRIWCICELYFAEQTSLLYRGTIVAGPDSFSHLKTRFSDAKATSDVDKERISQLLLPAQNRIDSWISRLRQVGHIPYHAAGRILSLEPDNDPANRRRSKSGGPCPRELECCAWILPCVLLVPMVVGTASVDTAFYGGLYVFIAAACLACAAYPLMVLGCLNLCRDKVTDGPLGRPSTESALATSYGIKDAIKRDELGGVEC